MLLKDLLKVSCCELYKMIIGLLLDKHLDYVCEHETNIDDDTLEDINSQYDYPSSDEYWTNGDNDVDEDNFMIQTGAC